MMLDVMGAVAVCVALVALADLYLDRLQRHLVNLQVDYGVIIRGHHAIRRYHWSGRAVQPHSWDLQISCLLLDWRVQLA